MSSHHIVREKQEPALIIANGEMCSLPLIEQLLEWSPYVLVLDGALERVLDLNIKIDAVLGDFDKAIPNIENLEKVQFPIEVIHTPDQNKTDLEKGIEYLIEKGFPAANIIWATGRRADHTLANISYLPNYINLIKLVMIDDYSIIYPIAPLPFNFSKWYKAGSSISLLPVGVASKISTLNLKYSLVKEDLILGKRNGNSNEAQNDGIVEINYESGQLLIMECSD